jgi:hypothetical protein
MYIIIIFSRKYNFGKKNNWILIIIMFLREYTYNNIIRNICLDYILKLGIIITKY